MMQGNRSSLYRHGFHSGLTEWRYGQPERPRKHIPIFDGALREGMVRRTIELVRNWQSSPFENEGRVRSELRSWLCLLGFEWQQSDQEAANLISEAFHKLGARRPTYLQGQPEHTAYDGRCLHCGREMPEGREGSKLCSAECAKAQMERRDEHRRKHDIVLRKSAYAVLTRARSAMRDCTNCGKPFSPKGDGSAQKFCSKRCSHDFRAKEEARSVPRECAWCGGDYYATSTKSRFCSNGCQIQESRFRTKGVVSTGISWRVFDRFITVPAEAARPKWITPERFDELVAA